MNKEETSNLKITKSKILNESVENKESSINCEVIRYTLKSYIGEYVNNTNPEEKAKMIGKFNNLSSKEFGKFVGDIINEIHRRTNLEYKKAKDHRMRKKLAKMKEETFKNLVYDTLQIYNLRFPCEKKDLDNDIESISNLISVLKNKEQAKEQIINEHNTTLKYKFFLDYIKQTYECKDDRIVEYMVKYTDDNLEEELNGSYDILFNYKLLIDKLNTTKYSQLTKYKIYIENLNRLENKQMNRVIKKELITEEFFNIIKLIIDNQYFYEEDIISKNVKHIISIIQRIDLWDYNNQSKTTLKIQDELDIKTNISNIAEVCKGMDFVRSEDVKVLNNIKSKSSITYENVFTLIGVLRNVLESIKKSNANDEK